MSRFQLGKKPEPFREVGRRNAAFYLFCVFIVSYFGRFTRRVPVLGAIHLDFLLAAATLAAIVVAGRTVGATVDSRQRMDPVAKRLWIVFAYIIVTLPFVEWPGSVAHNLETWGKSVCFFLFVVATVDTTRKLHVLLAVYVSTQIWRALEPLYMHVRFGYWGDFTSLGNWEFMDRLSGSPYDIINPNGLGFVIIMALPLLHFLVKPDTTVRRIAWFAIAGAMCYALVLSASRSSFLAFVFMCVLAIWRSKHRAAWLTAGVLGAVIGLALMTDLQRERYVSIFSHKAKGGDTAELRITGVIGDFKVSLRRPFFGHGLGTSQEANAHFRGAEMLSHDLYTETAEELGYIGLVLVLNLIWSFLRACWTTQRIVSSVAATDPRAKFLRSVANSLVIIVAVDLFYSFAAYGLSEPYWYFIGGISVVTARLAVKVAAETGQLNSDQNLPPSLRSPPDRGRRGTRRPQYAFAADTSLNGMRR
jgi:putative inorganic carbon (hco3(-)) transporter